MQAVDYSLSEINNSEAWYRYNLILRQMLGRIIGFGLGSTDFVHGTFGPQYVAQLLAAKTTLVHRVPT